MYNKHKSLDNYSKAVAQRVVKPMLSAVSRSVAQSSFSGFDDADVW